MLVPSESGGEEVTVRWPGTPLCEAALCCGTRRQHYPHVHLAVLSQCKTLGKAEWDLSSRKQHFASVSFLLKVHEAAAWRKLGEERRRLHTV